MTKEKYTDVSKYDDLKSCLREMRAHAALSGVSCIAMPRIRVVDDPLEGSNVAICLVLIFEVVYCTLTVYNTETEQDSYTIPVKTPRENQIIAQ